MIRMTIDRICFLTSLIWSADIYNKDRWALYELGLQDTLCHKTNGSNKNKTKHHSISGTIQMHAFNIPNVPAEMQLPRDLTSGGSFKNTQPGPMTCYANVPLPGSKTRPISTGSHVETAAIAIAIHPACGVSAPVAFPCSPITPSGGSLGSKAQAMPFAAMPLANKPRY